MSDNIKHHHISHTVTSHPRSGSVRTQRCTQSHSAFSRGSVKYFRHMQRPNKLCYQKTLNTLLLQSLKKKHSKCMGKLVYYSFPLLDYYFFSISISKLTLHLQYCYPKPDGLFIVAHKNIFYSMVFLNITYSI